MNPLHHIDPVTATTAIRSALIALLIVSVLAAVHGWLRVRRGR